MLRTVAAALALLAAQPAAAQDLRVIASWTHGDWLTTTMQNVDFDRRFCAAETTSDTDQVFRIVLYEDDDAFLEVLDGAWDFPGGDSLRFVVSVDGADWTLDGQGWHGAITWDLLDAGDRNELFSRLSNGERLELRMARGDTVATFSLDGADAAIVEANRCWAVERDGGTYQP